MEVIDKAIEIFKAALEEQGNRRICHVKDLGYGLKSVTIHAGSIYWFQGTDLVEVSIPELGPRCEVKGCHSETFSRCLGVKTLQEVLKGSESNFLDNGRKRSEAQLKREKQIAEEQGKLNWWKSQASERQRGGTR